MLVRLIVKLVNLIFKEDCFYLTNGTNLLPEKLNEDEEKSVLNKLQSGDVDARKELIERNLRLVVYIAQKFENTGFGVEDLTSIGTIGLIKATKSYDMSKNIKFATYASRCIGNEILMFLRKTTRQKCEISLDETLSSDKDGNELVLADVLGDEDENSLKKIEQQMDNENIMNLIEGLNPREKCIMKLRYGINSQNKEFTQKEVADILKISQSYISRIEKKVLERLKKDIVC